MPGIGTLVNVIAVVGGSVIGLFVKKGLPERFKSILMQALGLSVTFIGVSGVLQGMYKVSADGKLDRQYIMIMIFSLVIGGVVGELINIDELLNRLGNWIQGKLSKDGNRFSEGFVSASLLFCVGAMAIIGSLEDGLTGNAGTLFAKSLLDGVASIIFASTMGIGVAFSAVSIFVYQGAITLLAVWVKPWLTDIVISQMSLVGSILIFAIGIGLLEIKKIKLGNFLPAIFIPLIYYIIVSLF